MTIDKRDLTGPRQPYPIGDTAYGQVVQALKDLPISQTIRGKNAVISHNNSGDNEIVENPGPLKYIVVWSYGYIVEAAVDVRWESGADGRALGGQMAYTAAGQGISRNGSYPIPALICDSNTNLNMELNGAVLVQGDLVYTIEDV